MHSDLILTLRPGDVTNVAEAAIDVVLVVRPGDVTDVAEAALDVVLVVELDVVATDLPSVDDGADTDASPFAELEL
jgi:hypothetical protein